MTFRAREKKRLIALKPQLFSPAACCSGTYDGTQYDFCLRNDCSAENLHESIRAEAIAYFEAREIPWHDGECLNKANDRPGNHLCCSQSACVNLWFPFIREPKALAALLRSLGYGVDEVLPFELDGTLPGGDIPFVAFEWIGRRNYLKERIRGQEGRTRGAGFTSLDFAIRYRNAEKNICIIAGEWKYTEMYDMNKSIRFSKRGTDRLGIYRPSFDDVGCQINLGDLDPASLLYDPFDQLMRQQLLASAMEAAHEMSAEFVSLLHVAPRANDELIKRITSPGLVGRGDSIHEVWSSLVTEGRFRGVQTEDLILAATSMMSGSSWSDYMTMRYGAMR